jgi:two-component system nitrogen regulation response regulator NtrX
MSADILVVDDETDIRELIGGILEDEGYEARLAANSDDALAAICRAPPIHGGSGHLAAGLQGSMGWTS